MNYQVGDLAIHKVTGDMGIIIKRYHTCADFWRIALPNGIAIIHGSQLKPLEKK